MSKRVRFIIVLLVIALCFVFLHPTLKWYFWTEKEDKALALASREKIKDYSENMARADVDKLIEMAASNSTEPLSEKYAPIIKEAKARRKALGMEIPSQWTAQEVVASFKLSSKEKFITAAQPILETAYRDSILGIKNYQTNAVKLGLDLSGGMLVIIKADLDAAISADGASNETIADSKKAAMTLALDPLRSRIDKFGLTDPVIRRQGDDRIYIEMPGAADADKINSIIMGRGILAFHIVDDEATQAFREYYRNNPGKTFDAE